ncbi:L,D-transpeptidase family protein [Hyphobacterium sp.]|jgi:murein L,D-transpeptidase YcbB/YkuD|uniref:L,D-transpeptidase family protein n=1 Tax=Hyphobacterium sp. TaxID=2004662 RepID=UPI003BABE422
MLRTRLYALGWLLLAGAAHGLTAECRACETSGRFYQERDQALAWTGPANAQLLGDLLLAVRGAASHGLDPKDYHLEALEAADPQVGDREIDELATDAYLTLAAHLLAGRLDPVSIEPNWTAARRGRDLSAYLQSALAQNGIADSLEALAPRQPGYQALRDALAQYRTIAAEGGWPTIDDGDLIRPGDSGPRIAQLRARLAATGHIAAESENPELYDDALVDAVRGFQDRGSLDSDGVIGTATLRQLNMSAEERVRQIEINLERWRWLPEDMGRRHILVNIADYRLEAWNDGRMERTHDVVVGQLFRRTPVFSGSMTYFVLNPWWETPHSLAIRDKLPAFRRDPSSVQRLGFQIIDRSGNLVDPDTIDWTQVEASNFPYRLRQAPGPLNALGEVKFIFPNRHNVYLHDTPTRGLFAQRRRNFSSGCIRVRDPLALAAWVAAETPAWPSERIESVAAGNTETRVSLAQGIPVHVLYATVVPDESTGVRFLNDIYGRDQAVRDAMDAPPPPLEIQ